MAELIGADIERLRDMAQSFEQRAEAVRSIERRVTSACGELGQFWHGADAAEFVAAWQSGHRPRMLAAADGLVEASEVLGGNADQQEVTSSADGDGVGSGGGGGGGGRFGFSLGLPSLGDVWDGATDLAGDAWNGATELAGDAWDGASAFTSDAWDGITDTAGSAWGSITSAGGAVLGETGHRLTEFGQYGRAYLDRWTGNPIQSAFDELTFTGQFERLVGSGAILLLGGEFQENIGDGDAEFITGLPFKFNDAITLGHSVLVDDARPGGGLVEHELQHVDDVEAVGGLGFYTSYLANWAGNIIGGQDPSIGGEAYENIWWEQRADAAQDGSPPFDLDFGRFDPRNWFD